MYTSSWFGTWLSTGTTLLLPVIDIVSAVVAEFRNTSCLGFLCFCSIRCFGEFDKIPLGCRARIVTDFYDPKWNLAHKYCCKLCTPNLVHNFVSYVGNEVILFYFAQSVIRAMKWRRMQLTGHVEATRIEKFIQNFKLKIWIKRNTFDS